MTAKSKSFQMDFRPGAESSLQSTRVPVLDSQGGRDMTTATPPDGSLCYLQGQRVHVPSVAALDAEPSPGTRCLQASGCALGPQARMLHASLDYASEKNPTQYWYRLMNIATKGARHCGPPDLIVLGDRKCKQKQGFVQFESEFTEQVRGDSVAQERFLITSNLGPWAKWKYSRGNGGFA